MNPGRPTAVWQPGGKMEFLREVERFEIKGAPGRVYLSIDVHATHDGQIGTFEFPMRSDMAMAIAENLFVAACYPNGIKIVDLEGPPPKDIADLYLF